MAIIQKEGQRGAETFPKNKDEIKKARTNMVKMIHSDDVQKRIAGILQGDPNQIMQKLPQLIAQAVGRIVTSIKGRFGSKVHIKLIEMLTKLAIDEVSLIAKGLGLGPIPPQTKQQLMQEAGNMMDQVLGKPQGQPQGQPQQGQQPMAPQGPMQPQGPPQGPMQAPDQGLLGG